MAKSGGTGSIVLAAIALVLHAVAKMKESIGGYNFGKHNTSTNVVSRLTLSITSAVPGAFKPLQRWLVHTVVRQLSPEILAKIQCFAHAKMYLIPDICPHPW
jgi:hypothetical protein